MAGVSATILKIASLNEREFNRNSFTLAEQSSLDEYGADVNRLGLPRTKIRKLHEESDFIKYEASMSTETIEKPIYIFEDGYQEYSRGYQEIEKFEFWIMTDKSIMVIFAPKSTANLFVRRLKRVDYLSTKHICFDFSRIGELENMDSAWGYWQDSEGIVRRIAKFGKGLNTEVEDFSSITTFYIDYSYGADIVRLILGREGVLSTSNEITKRDLYVIYREIAQILCE